MGPSGAGKTTLLNVLTGTKTLKHGGIYLNGRSIKLSLRGLYAFIPQDNILFPGLTPRQSLYYAARLYLPSSMDNSAINDTVSETMEKLKLLNCADTMIGDLNNRGISGGERRRTSIALDLISDPKLLFADEPTSGKLCSLQSMF